MKGLVLFFPNFFLQAMSVQHPKNDFLNTKKCNVNAVNKGYIFLRPAARVTSQLFLAIKLYNQSVEKFQREWLVD